MPELPKNPDIALDKTGAATANAGETFTYSFTATNTGDVTLANVVLTDDKCQSTLTRTGANLADQTFDPGDEWNYTCTVIAPAGPATVDNLAEVCGDYVPPKGPPVDVCDEDTHTIPAAAAVTPPVNPPDDPPVTPRATRLRRTRTTPGSGGVLPERALPARPCCAVRADASRRRSRLASAAAASPPSRSSSTAAGQAVNKQRASYAVKMKPSRFGFGRHRVIARVRFVAAAARRTAACRSRSAAARRAPSPRASPAEPGAPSTQQHRRPRAIGASGRQRRRPVRLDLDLMVSAARPRRAPSAPARAPPTRARVPEAR